MRSSTAIISHKPAEKTIAEKLLVTLQFLTTSAIFEISIIETPRIFRGVFTFCPFFHRIRQGGESDAEGWDTQLV